MKSVTPSFSPSTKTCRLCGLNKTTDQFRRQSQNGDGLDTTCRSCHNQQTRERTAKRSDLQVLVDRKKCNKCQLTKLATEFYRSRHSPDCLYTLCKDCLKENRKRYSFSRRDYVKRHAERNPEKYLAASRRAKYKRYGITPEIFSAMCLEQGGKCAICGATPKELLHVDHDHLTGSVRGLLCQHCNRGIGLFKDSIQSLKNAVEYLERNCNDKTKGNASEVF